MIKTQFPTNCNAPSHRLLVQRRFAKHQIPSLDYIDSCLLVPCHSQSYTLDIKSSASHFPKVSSCLSLFPPFSFPFDFLCMLCFATLVLSAVCISFDVPSTVCCPHFSFLHPPPPSTSPFLASFIRSEKTCVHFEPVYKYQCRKPVSFWVVVLFYIQLVSIHHVDSRCNVSNHPIHSR